MKNSSLFKKGLIDGIPIFLGYLAVSFAFGIQAADIDLSPFQAGLLSLLNVTSAGQFAGLTVIAAAGSYIELAVLQLIVNLRYLLMSAALSQKLPGDTPTIHRMGIAYGVTDEIFGLSVLTEGPLRPAYSYGLIVVSVTGWVLGTVLGAAAGAILPHRLISALGVALYGMFIAIIIPPARDETPVRITVFMAMVMSTLYSVIPVLRDLSGGMKIIIVTITVSSLAAIWMPRDLEDEGRGES